MKKILTAFVVLLVCAGMMSFTPSAVTPAEKSPALNASSIMIPVGKDGKKISLLELSTISRSELEKLTGKKMNGMQRMAFKGAQKKLQKGINAQGEVTGKKLKKMFGQGKADGGGGFHLGGFALGFFLGLIGVLLAYVVFDDENKKSRIKWSWLGLAASVILTIILVVAVFSSAT